MLHLPFAWSNQLLLLLATIATATFTFHLPLSLLKASNSFFLFSLIAGFALCCICFFLILLVFESARRLMLILLLLVVAWCCRFLIMFAAWCCCLHILLMLPFAHFASSCLSFAHSGDYLMLLFVFRSTLSCSPWKVWMRLWRHPKPSTCCRGSFSLIPCCSPCSFLLMSCML